MDNRIPFVDGAVKEAKRLVSAGRGADALELLRTTIRGGALSPEEMESAGRLILRELAVNRGNWNPLPVLILGQCTTAWVAPALAAAAWSRDMPCLVEEGDFDNVLQSLLALPVFTEDAAPVLILLPWHQRLLGADSRAPTERVDDELNFWRQVWNVAMAKRVRALIQVGYDWTGPGALGYHLAASPDGPIATVDRVNIALRAELPAGSYFLALGQVSSMMGRERFYDARRYLWTRQPFSEAGTARLAEHLAGAVRAVTVGPRKVLALDLDNTIWGGVVGEVGSQGIAISDGADGEAFREFQRYLKGLAERGILLVACSKNNPDDAREPFLRNPGMLLRLEDFAAFEANWEPKPESLERIAKVLGLSLDSFVFFDDSEAEQELVRRTLPEVAVVDVPDDPADFAQAVQDSLWFEAVNITAEDRRRSTLYAEAVRCREKQTSSSTMEEYLASLDMIGTVRYVSDMDMERVVQLLAKTNQFNLTSRRHSASQLRDLLRQDGAFCLTMQVGDRFGALGLVGLAIAVPVQRDGIVTGELTLDSFLLSCRAIGRTAEQFLMARLLTEATRRGHSGIFAEYVPTPKNALVADLFDKMGFVRIHAEDLARSEGRRLYRYALPAGELPSSAIHEGAEA